jgi:hypothetical protein
MVMSHDYGLRRHPGMTTSSLAPRERYPMIKNGTLTRTKPPPPAAWLERRLALGGVAGPLLFVLAFTVAGLLRAGLFAGRPGDQRPWDRRGRLDRERIPDPPWALAHRLCDQLLPVHPSAVPHGVAGR